MLFFLIIFLKNNLIFEYNHACTPCKCLGKSLLCLFSSSEFISTTFISSRNVFVPIPHTHLNICNYRISPVLLYIVFFWFGMSSPLQEIFKECFGSFRYCLLFQENLLDSHSCKKGKGRNSVIRTCILPCLGQRTVLYSAWYLWCYLV